MNAPMSQELLDEIRRDDRALHSESSLTKNQRHRRELLAEVDRLRAELDRARPVLEAALRYETNDTNPAYEGFWDAVRAWREGDEHNGAG